MTDDVISARLRRRIRRDFPGPQACRGVEGALRSLLDKLGPSGSQDAVTERLFCAVVLFAAGDVRRMKPAVEMALMDWRDLLMATGLAHEDWPARLDAELGTS
ncbi:hypothetical protein ACWGLE_09210 [Streptomyces sp. NPDC055897]